MGVAEELAEAGLEVLERERVVVGVEGGLVPLVGEASGELVRRVPLVLGAGVGVAAEVVVVVPALEVLVHQDFQ